MKIVEQLEGVVNKTGAPVKLKKTNGVVVELQPEGFEVQTSTTLLNSTNVGGVAVNRYKPPVVESKKLNHLYLTRTSNAPRAFWCDGVGQFHNCKLRWEEGCVTNILCDSDAMYNFLTGKIVKPVQPKLFEDDKITVDSSTDTKENPPVVSQNGVVELSVAIREVGQAYRKGFLDGFYGNDAGELAVVEQ